MNRHLWILWLGLAGSLLLALLPAGAEEKASVLLNGTFNSGLDLQQERLFPSGDSAAGWGWSNFVNLRFKSQPNEDLSFYLSLNLAALAGYYAERAGSSFLPALVALERLYFKVGSEWLDTEAGLIRIPRGYGFVFSPLDILNERDATNSLDPEARPRGRWGLHTTFYPQDMWKLEVFGLAPDNPFEKAGWGSKFGLATTFSLGTFNWDLLYALYLPEVAFNTTPAPPLPPYANNDFVQAAGFAFKADIEIGLFAEALYRFNHGSIRTGTYYGRNYRWYNGLEAALGVDYTLPDTDLYLLAEYLFYGSGHVDWDTPELDALYLSPGWEDLPLTARLPNPDKLPQPYARHDYLFLLARYTPAEDLRLGCSCLLGWDDLSALLTAYSEYDLVQGLTLQASYLLPVDRKLFDAGAPAGEWGSTRLGFVQLLRLGAKMKF